MRAFILAYWTYEGLTKTQTNSVDVHDISLADYIQTRHAVYLPHTAGRYAKKQFKKAQMPIVERLVDRCVLVSTQTPKNICGHIRGWVA